jgi:hypothetical protein
MFYKILDNTNLTFGPSVQSEDYTLVSDEYMSYTFPIDGWYWFDTIEEANTFFGIVPEDQP